MNKSKRGERIIKLLKYLENQFDGIDFDWDDDDLISMVLKFCDDLINLDHQLWRITALQPEFADRYDDQYHWARRKIAEQFFFSLGRRKVLDLHHQCEEYCMEGMMF